MNWKVISDNIKQEKRIAFLFIDEIHHLYHFVTVAKELAKTNKVHILTYNSPNPLLYKLLKDIKAENVIVEELPTYTFRALTDKLKKKKIPRKGFWIKKNTKYILNNFDAVVFTDFFHKYLLKDRKQNSPKLLKFPHGTAGRAYAFKNNELDFDFQLLVGKFQYDQFKNMGLLGDFPVIAGYPKIDAVQQIPQQEFFTNNKPTVLYNPHFDPEFSSWKKDGLKVLEFFYAQTEYNLIFAPHINLFKGNQNKNTITTIPEHLFAADNIHIDLGSEASANMTYTRAADIYLGDVSSQVYEFIIEPRPCIFINSYDFEYKNDFSFRFWKCGPVINKIEDLMNSLEKVQKDFNNYKKVQERISAENFYNEEGSSPSERSAKAISAFLNGSLEMLEL